MITSDESKIAGGRHLAKKSINRRISATARPIVTKSGTMTQNGRLYAIGR